MEEVKLRMAVLEFFGSGKGHALYQPSTVESCCLQVRKILELIAFGSLAANKDIYSQPMRSLLPIGTLVVCSEILRK